MYNEGLGREWSLAFKVKVKVQAKVELERNVQIKICVLNFDWICRIIHWILHWQMLSPKYEREICICKLAQIWGEKGL